MFATVLASLGGGTHDELIGARDADDIERIVGVLALLFGSLLSTLIAQRVDPAAGNTAFLGLRFNHVA